MTEIKKTHLYYQRKKDRNWYIQSNDGIIDNMGYAINEYYANLFANSYNMKEILDIVLKVQYLMKPRMHKLNGTNFYTTNNKYEIEQDKESCQYNIFDVNKITIGGSFWGSKKTSELYASSEYMVEQLKLVENFITISDLYDSKIHMGLLSMIEDILHIIKFNKLKIGSESL